MKRMSGFLYAVSAAVIFCACMVVMVSVAALPKLHTADNAGSTGLVLKAGAELTTQTSMGDYVRIKSYPGTLGPGESYNLEWEASGAVTFSSSDPNVAVDSSGRIYVYSWYGSSTYVTITARCGNAEDSIEIYAFPATSTAPETYMQAYMDIYESDITLSYNDPSCYLTFHCCSLYSVYFECDNPYVTVSSDGKVTVSGAYSSFSATIYGYCVNYRNADSAYDSVVLHYDSDPLTLPASTTTTEPITETYTVPVTTTRPVTTTVPVTTTSPVTTTTTVTATDPVFSANLPAVSLTVGDVQKITANHPVAEYALSGDFAHMFGDILVADKPGSGYLMLMAENGDTCTVRVTVADMEVSPGDVTMDGKLSVADVIQLQKFLLGKGHLTYPIAADMDGNNAVNVLDIMILKRRVMQ